VVNIGRSQFPSLNRGSTDRPRVRFPVSERFFEPLPKETFHFFKILIEGGLQAEPCLFQFGCIFVECQGDEVTQIFDDHLTIRSAS
jgi:hypothetical protein